MAQAYPDDIEKIALLLNRERNAKMALVFACMALLVIAGAVVAQLTGHVYLPYVPY